MTKDTLICGEVNIPMSEISDLAMHGQNALVFSAGKDYYEAITPKETNALKYMLYYQAVKT